ncbi:N,N-dimethylformamidase beta subunit family domain-containing protein [Microtetraspora niveoalba]|uniref:N,N-dimethylformamidase beta subunit family domain-containing protein n=1 Tax=Microtetraspora niveoalba TaxID=46175 RepID=UPI00082B3664|nr:N,N-dimethylformamidase beta subunit family domain-containing protein [Microtetraspora niveoalba]
MIRGYVEQPSPRAGDRLTLRAATDAPEFRVQFHRCGAELEPCGTSEWLPGRAAPQHLPFQDWGVPGAGLGGEPLDGWAGYRLRAPDRPGVYVAILVEGDGDGRETAEPDRTTADGREARALFVVRPPRPSADILYKIPLLTYHAYNVVDGRTYDPRTRRGHWCLYNTPAPEELPVEPVPGVGLHRPGGGTGGTPWDIGNFDPFDPTPRQTFVHWDGRFIAWMERRGYTVDYCTDLDLHREGAALLLPYRLLVSAGHDEYWSDAMRAAVEGHVAAGGNAAFFGGNTCWWRVVFHDDVTFSRVGVWHETGRPENALIGVSFRNGGERDRDEHPIPVGYRVQHAGHWVYDGTGVRDGDVFGEREHLIGYECDGAEFDRNLLAAGVPVVPTGADGTPRDFTILAVGDTRPSGWGHGNAAATMGVTAGLDGRGTVFNAATTDWARALTGSPVVERATRNVLDRLSRG